MSTNSQTPVPTHTHPHTMRRVLPAFMTPGILQLPSKMQSVAPSEVGLSQRQIDFASSLLFDPLVKLINSDYEQIQTVWTQNLTTDIVDVYQWMELLFLAAFGRVGFSQHEFVRYEDGTAIVGIYLPEEDRESIFRYALEVRKVDAPGGGENSSWMSPWIFFQMSGDMVEIFTPNQERFLDTAYLFSGLAAYGCERGDHLLHAMDYAFATRAITQIMNDSFVMSGKKFSWDNNAIRVHEVCLLPRLVDLACKTYYDDLRHAFIAALMTYTDLAEADFVHRATVHISLFVPTGGYVVELELLDD